MRSDYTHISFLLDNSGSMASRRKNTIEAFNNFLESQKKLPGKLTFSLYEFQLEHDAMNPHNLYFYGIQKGSAKPIYEFADGEKVPLINEETYVCDTSTPLVDTYVNMIDRTGSILAAMPEATRPERVMLVSLTDGEENASYRFTKAQLKTKIEHQTATYKWDFVYLGANQDAIAEAASLGIQASKTMNFTTSKMGAVTDSMSLYTANFRGASSLAAASASAFTDEDREKNSG